MLLKIVGRDSNKLIKVQPDFFLPTKTRVNGKSHILTPVEKSEQIGMDTFGRNYLGFVLEENGVVIKNTLENRDGRKSIHNLMRFH